jgi:hypothetical protein
VARVSGSGQQSGGATLTESDGRRVSVRPLDPVVEDGNVPDPKATERPNRERLDRLEEWIGVVSALTTILLSLAIAALILERGS